MLIKNLYRQVLIDPIDKGANKLYIVSGFSSGAFAASHLREVLSKNREVKVHLIHGMHSGKHPTSHSIFLSLLKSYPNNFFLENAGIIVDMIPNAGRIKIYTSG